MICALDGLNDVRLHHVFISLFKVMIIVKYYKREKERETIESSWWCLYPHGTVSFIKLITLRFSMLYSHKVSPVRIQTASFAQWGTEAYVNTCVTVYDWVQRRPVCIPQNVHAGNTSLELLPCSCRLLKLLLVTEHTFLPSPFFGTISVAVKGPVTPHISKAQIWHSACPSPVLG